MMAGYPGYQEFSAKTQVVRVPLIDIVFLILAVTYYMYI